MRKGAGKEEAEIPFLSIWAKKAYEILKNLLSNSPGSITPAILEKKKPSKIVQRNRKPTENLPNEPR